MLNLLQHRTVVFIQVLQPLWRVLGVWDLLVLLHHAGTKHPGERRPRYTEEPNHGEDVVVTTLMDQLKFSEETDELKSPMWTNAFRNRPTASSYGERCVLAFIESKVTCAGVITWWDWADRSAPIQSGRAAQPAGGGGGNDHPHLYQRQ